MQLGKIPISDGERDEHDFEEVVCSAAKQIDKDLRDELEMTADKLTDCWLFLDELARSSSQTIPSEKRRAAELLRKQGCPGWKQ